VVVAGRLFLCIYVIHGIFIYGDDTADVRP